MRTAGIVVEYNPLHNGHVYHYQQTRIISGAEAIVAVMSGHFLQRGEPAIVNKWARAEMALAMGADVVIELPVAYSSQPAEWFAFGAVSALHASGVVDALCFGSESGDIEWLKTLASLLAKEPERFQPLLQQQLKQGMNYPAAYTAAVSQFIRASEASVFTGDIDFEALAKPNNTLGLHYLIALNRLHSDIQPMTITRTKAGYNEQNITDAHIASATAIRRILLEERHLDSVKPYVPDYTLDILQREWAAGRAPIDWERFALPLYHTLLRSSSEELADIAEVTEGLENRMLGALAELKDNWTVEHLLTLLKTKRYTRTKLQRALTRVLLGHRKEMTSKPMLRQGVPYLRVLGFSRKGRTLLKRMKKQATVPVITNVGRDFDPMLKLDIQASGIYAAAYERLDSRETLRDYYEPPIYME